jgi:hypothetical protein
MKHLTTYNLHESFLHERKEVRNYINDLFAEVKSNGVRIFVYCHRVPTTYKIIIGEYSDQVMFSYSDVSDEIGHMISYFINDGNMRLGDVNMDGDFVKGRAKDYGKIPGRLLGWEKLKFLETMKDEKCIFSITINFESRGGSFL